MSTDPIQGYRVTIAKKYGLAVAIIYDKVQFWSDKGSRKDGWVYKTHEEMSDETALSVKQIRLAYKKLEELEIVETDVKQVYGIPKKHFRLVQKDKSMEKAKRTSPINTETNTETNNKKINKKVLDSSSSDFGADVTTTPKAPSAQLLTDIINIVNPREKPTTERIRALNGRLKDYTADEITGAARALSKSEWHKDNKQMSIDNLLAPSKFGRWYAQRDTETPPNTAPKIEKTSAEREKENKERDWGF